MKKISMSFTRIKDSDLTVYASNVVQKMTGNEHYKDSESALVDVSTAHDEFNKAVLKAENGTPTDKIVKNQKKEVLLKVLQQLARIVEMHAQGDEAILSTSGFEMVKTERVAIGPLARPESLSVVPNYGAAKVGVKRLTGARAYCFEYTEAPVSPNSVWLVQTSVGANAVIPGLKSGVPYCFRAYGIGSNPTKTYSDIITSFIL